MQDSHALGPVPRIWSWLEIPNGYGLRAGVLLWARMWPRFVLTLARGRQSNCTATAQILGSWDHLVQPYVYDDCATPQI